MTSWLVLEEILTRVNNNDAENRNLAAIGNNLGESSNPIIAVNVPILKGGASASATNMSSLRAN